MKMKKNIIPMATVVILCVFMICKGYSSTVTKEQYEARMKKEAQMRKDMEKEAQKRKKAKEQVQAEIQYQLNSATATDNTTKE
jgi:sortase (surface protein transpeptidase)